MPAKRKKISPWRLMMVQTHPKAKQELRRKLKTPTQAKMYINKLSALKHLADRTQYNIIMALFSDMVDRKVLQKEGSFYFRREK